MKLFPWQVVSSHIFGSTQTGDDDVGSFGPGYMMPLTSRVHFLLVSSMKLLSAEADPQVLGYSSYTTLRPFYLVKTGGKANSQVKNRKEGETVGG